MMEVFSKSEILLTISWLVMTSLTGFLKNSIVCSISFAISVITLVILEEFSVEPVLNMIPDGKSVNIANPT